MGSIAKKIDQLDELLKEVDQLEDLRGSHRLKPAAAKAISQIEHGIGTKLPSSYRQFLAVSNGFFGFWGGMNIIGASGAGRSRTLRQFNNQKRTLRRITKSATELDQGIPLGADTDGNALIFEPTRVRRGEMSIAWIGRGGGVDFRFQSFDELLDHALKMASKRLKAAKLSAKKEKKRESQAPNIKGATFAITGKLWPGMDQGAARRNLSPRGAKLAPKWTKAVQYLVVGKSPNKVLVKEARAKGTKLLSPEEFKVLLWGPR